MLEAEPGHFLTEMPAPDREGTFPQADHHWRRLRGLGSLKVPCREKDGESSLQEQRATPKDGGDADRVVCTLVLRCCSQGHLRPLEDLGPAGRPEVG